MKSPNAQTVSDFIKRNFQTITRFADLAGLDETSVRNILKRVPGPALASLLAQAKAAVPKASQRASYELRPADVGQLRACIDDQHGGNASAFAREYRLGQQTLAQVLAGTRRRRSKLVVAIMQAAKVEGY